MRQKINWLVVVFLTLAFVTQAQTNSSFVQASGRQLVRGPDNEPFCIRGINLNTFWYDGPILIQSCCNQEHYTAISNMGFNTIRLELSYRFFEEDSNPFVYLGSGWNWLDQQIEFAKQHNLYLILAMIEPHGGNQITGDFDLWSHPLLQERLKALWAAIAQHYANETTIVAYDLLNEPVMPNNTFQWRSLAQQLVDAIRTNDANHLIDVEEVHTVWGNWIASIDPDSTQFLINDSNIVYDFHFYEPFEYTHQFTPWTGLGDGGKYPDTIYQTTSDMVFKTASQNDPSLPTGTSTWNSYQGGMFTVSEPPIFAGVPSFNYSLSSGTAYLDSIVIREFDESMNFIQDVWVWDIDLPDATNDWQGWGSGTFSVVSGTGASDNASLAVMNGTGGIVIRWLQFFAKPGYSYRVDAHMRGENFGAEDYARLSISFEGSHNGGTLMQRNKQYLEWEMSVRTAFGMQNDVPLLVGEFGPSRDSYTREGKGGIDYLKDMLDILSDGEISYCFFSHDFLHADYSGIPDTLFAAINFLTNYHDSFPGCGSQITGLSELDKPADGATIVYPNPFTNSTTIQAIGFTFEKADLKIYDLQGRIKVHMQNINGNQITLTKTNLTSGIYFYKLIDNNTLLISGKIISE